MLLTRLRKLEEAHGIDASCCPTCGVKIEPGRVDVIRISAHDWDPELDGPHILNPTLPPPKPRCPECGFGQIESYVLPPKYWERRRQPNPLSELAAIGETAVTEQGETE